MPPAKRQPAIGLVRPGKAPGTSRRWLWILPGAVPLVAVVVLIVVFSGGGGDVEDEATEPLPETLAATDDTALPVAPGLSQRRLSKDLTEAYERIDPSADGWRTEAFNEAAGGQLKHLAKWIEHPEKSTPDEVGQLAAAGFSCGPLRPDKLDEVFRDGSLLVLRQERKATVAAPPHTGPAGLAAAVSRLSAAFDTAADRRVKFKLFKIEPARDATFTTVYYQASGTTPRGKLQQSATWRCRWVEADSGRPRLESIEIVEYEEVHYHGPAGVMFADCTEAVLGGNPSYRDQLLYSSDHWRSRIPRELGLDAVANHGVAVGDVNGDELDDVYLCQQGGLPNRLFVQQPDGTLRDVSAESGTDWLDVSSNALLVDLDNDGDRDLVVAQELRIMFMSNDGRGRFRWEFARGMYAQTFSLCAADYDGDGYLDVFACGYNPQPSDQRSGPLGSPLPYHDANNGGRNMLLRNDLPRRKNNEDIWNFTDVTAQVGLDQNNTRFAFAAAWEDYDNDGDLDLYVANDYGRNNLYRNDGGKFVDVAGQLGVEDMSSGMSVDWADFNRDGVMDLYVSNMFSAAGNRITYQRQFQETIDPRVRRVFQRHARGNSLFAGDGRGGFRDVSVASGVTMGRWAWASKFVDLNSDGWQDLVVANGFITAEDTGDL